MKDLNKVLERNGNVLKLGESAEIQHKRSFSDRVKIMKTMAGMANNKGGHILIGVNDERTILGLSNEKLLTFNNMQNNKFPELIKEVFAPEINWDYDVDWKLKIGIITVKESEEKPIISKKNYGNIIKEGEIYYAYKKSIESIKYPELISLINKIKEKERKLQDKKYKELFNQINLFGIDNIDIHSKKKAKKTNYIFIQKDAIQNKENEPSFKIVEPTTLFKEIKSPSLKDFCKNPDELNWKIFNNETINYTEYVLNWHDMVNIQPTRNVCVFTLKSNVDETTFNNSIKFKENYDYKLKQIKKDINQYGFNFENDNNDDFKELSILINETKKDDIKRFANLSYHILKSRLNNKITTQSLKKLLVNIYNKNQNIIKNSFFRKVLVYYDYIINR